MERDENDQNEANESAAREESSLDGAWFRRYPSSMPPPRAAEDLDEEDPLSRDWFVP